MEQGIPGTATAVVDAARAVHPAKAVGAQVALAVGAAAALVTVMPGAQPLA